MTRSFRLRTIATAVIGLAAVAGAAGCTPQFGASSYPNAVPTGHRTHHAPPTAPASTSTTSAPVTSLPIMDPITAGPTATDPATGDPASGDPATTPPATPPTATTSPTTTPPTATTPTTTPPTTAACTTSAAKGSCGPYNYPRIQGHPSEVTVGQDVWNPISGWHQTLSATDPGNWSVMANMPNKNTAVVSFPNTGANYDSPLISSFPALYSSFSESMPTTSATNAHAAYDLWFNDWNDEVMIQNDFAPGGYRCDSYEASASFGGSHGVPVQTWYLCQFGSELIWQLKANEQSGSVDIKAMTTWLETKGYLRQNSTVTALSYGFEISSTGGQNEEFRVSDFSINTS